MGKIKLPSKPATLGGEMTAQRSLTLLSVHDTAEYLKVSHQTVRRAIKAGHLKTYRAGRQIRIDESDLVNYLSS